MSKQPPTPLGNTGKLSWDAVMAFHAAAPEQHLYAIFDGAHDERQLGTLQMRWPNLEWTSLYLGFPESAFIEVTPLLIAIPCAPAGEGKAIFEFLFSRRNIAKEGSLIFWSQHPLDALAAHLRQYAHVTLADGHRALVRFHDPNIWPAFVGTLTVQEHQHFLAPLTQIWRPDLDFIWWAEPGYRLGIPEPLPSHTWDNARQAAFAERTQPRKILGQLEDEHRERLSGSRTTYLQTIGEWLASANTLGAVTPGAQYLYSVIALIAGDRFATAPEVAPVLAAIGTTHASFEDAIGAIPASTWERLAEQTELSTTPKP